ncbi:hypothetical protein CSC94_01645 [Zhengella mangrovi]|uniref:NADH oxidase n=1 Tax=Zhengella mangrovi TaxID=1982044 RepID=A0A2G1QUL8_9HYPH|nr:DUF1150 family protein [Zhengella mangrovi]PHP69154.1 hypothetical protein CSC94_01645 [Zhengella mangrovi]
MTEDRTTSILSNSELAHLGEGQVAYVRKMKSDELLAAYPGIADIAPGLDIWTLFAANGNPILLANARDVAVAGAWENDLQAVSLH